MNSWSNVKGHEPSSLEVGEEWELGVGGDGVLACVRACAGEGGGHLVTLIRAKQLEE